MTILIIIVKLQTDGYKNSRIPNFDSKKTNWKNKKRNRKLYFRRLFRKPFDKKKRNWKNKKRNRKAYFRRLFRKPYAKIVRVGSSE